MQASAFPRPARLKKRLARRANELGMHRLAVGSLTE